MKLTLEQAVAGNIEALPALRGALGRADEALEFIRQGNRNAAIGCIADLEVVLADATALQAAARALHRQLRGAARLPLSPAWRGRRGSGW